MTMRMPSLSDSSRSSEMPSSFLSLTSSAILFQQPRLVHLVRQFGDNDGLTAAARFIDFDFGAGTHVDATAAGKIGLADAARAVDEGGGRKVRARHEAHQIDDAEFGGVDQRHAGVDDFGKIMRRDIGRHADRDAGRTIDQQVRNARRHDGRLALGFIVIGNEIDGLFIEIGEQFVRILAMRTSV